MNDAPNNVSGRVVNTEIGPAGECEVDLRSMAAADPVALHRLDRIGPVERVEVVDQAVGVRGDPHHPLAHVPLEDREVATVGSAVRGDLFVGDDGAQARAPVDRRIGDVGETVVVDDVVAFCGAAARSTAARRGSLVIPLSNSSISSSIGRAFCCVGVVPGVEDLAEDPLRPPVVGRVGRGDRATCVVAQPQAPQLTAHVGDVRIGRDRRVGAGLHGELFGGQAEGVEPHRVEHVVAGHPLVAARRRRFR